MLRALRTTFALLLPLAICLFGFAAGKWVVDWSEGPVATVKPAAAIASTTVVDDSRAPSDHTKPLAAKAGNRIDRRVRQASHVVVTPPPVVQRREPEPVAVTEPVAVRRRIAPVVRPEPTTKPERTPKYVVRSGVYRQRLADGADARYLAVRSDGRGQLVIHFSGLPALFVGTTKLVIDTTWTIDEAKDETTFTLHQGVPERAYRVALGTELDRVTRFRIEAFREDELVLRRLSDGEVFHWERVEP